MLVEDITSLEREILAPPAMSDQPGPSTSTRTADTRTGSPWLTVYTALQVSPSCSRVPTMTGA